MEVFMKVQLLVVTLGLGFCGCGVTLKDKKESVKPETEFVVEESYTLPLQRNMMYQQVVEYDRLILKKGARFQTEGANVRIDIKELVSEDAVIATFSPDTTAEKRKSGRAGGHLELHVGKATGNLTVELRGENGGDGEAGAEPVASMKGAQGAPGMDWIGGFGYSSVIYIPSAGNPGAQGFQGESGFPGGNSGSADIQISDDSELSLSVARIPGRGGAGGSGGAGGEGGEGGIGGQRGDLNRFPNGAMGPQGSQGPVGTVGATGLAERVCIRPKSGALNCQ